MQDQEPTIILGAGPAGLAAGYELVKNNQPVVLIEKQNQAGGMSQTKKFQDHFYDLGPHRFFSKSKIVNDLWQEVLGDDFLEIPRLTRIYYRKKFFQYPLVFLDSFVKLGLKDSLWAVFSLLSMKIKRLFIRKPEVSFEDWVSNRFGRKLFNTFFKSYTEKLWGLSTKDLSARWASQRIKNLSLVSALKDSLIKAKHGKVQTLIDKFHYPKYGAGMMYEKMAEIIEKKHGEIIYGWEVIKIKHNNNKIEAVVIKKGDETKEINGKNFISSLPIDELIKKMEPITSEPVSDAAKNLKFRSLVIITLMVNTKKVFPDNWIYVHEPDLQVNRIQDYSNWGSHLKENQDQTMIGIEYACWLDDQLWNMSDEEWIAKAKKDFLTLELVAKEKIGQGIVNKIIEAYPVYAFDYQNNLDTIFEYLKQFKNFQTIGRSGMFHYNNMDHSVLTGFYAARNLMGEDHNLFEINVNEDYHETKLP